MPGMWLEKYVCFAICCVLDDDDDDDDDDDEVGLT